LTKSKERKQNEEGEKMERKRPFPLSYESDGLMGKKTKKQSDHAKKEKKERDFFNTTPASE
jgi:hypothetical protein